MLGKGQSGRTRARARAFAVLFDLGLIGLVSLGATAVAQAGPRTPSPLQVARAGPASPSTADPRLVAECAELRAQLDRKTAEISALKRAERGVRQDYDLRQRMAEANDLARRLTTLESELVRQGHGPSQAPSGAASPVAAPVEAAATLQARADLLSDEAHKLNERAAGMIRAAGQLRTRQALRRKAANVERDPFASVDGAKRTLFVRGAAPVTDTAGGKGAAQTGNTEATAGSAPGSSGAPMPTTPPTPLAGPMTTAPTGPPATPPTAPPATGTPISGAQDPSRGATPPPNTPSGRSELAPGALLDPALRAELSRVDGGVISGSNQPDSLEQAARALVSRAQALETQAKALRAQAASH
jgi:hypothetical protein